MNSLESKVVTATKWSALTEIASKLISPISTMILARLLTPEAYGAVATTTIIISFAELFTDAGFQKYIIQHDFTDDDDRDKSINVAFWSNLVMSLIIWGIIIALRHPIARLVGSPGLETAIAVACAAIPIAAFSSIQSAIYKRNLNFRVPFIVRMIGLGLTFFVTIPLAFWLRSYWALIISSLIQGTTSAGMLTFYSDWKPKIYYSFKRLKEMLGFCSTIIINSILVWINTTIVLFLVSSYFDNYTLGIYKTSISKATGLLSIISTSIIPILLPTFSKLQNDASKLKNTMLDLQKVVSVILLPLSFTIFLYSEIITRIFLGSQWNEAAQLIGIWTLVSSFSLLINHFCGKALTAIGKPQLSTIISILYLSILIPSVIITIKYGFKTVFYTHALTNIWLIILHLIAIYIYIKLSPFKIFSNIMPELIGCGIMIGLSDSLSAICNTTILQIVSMLICLAAYFVFLFSLRSERLIIKKIWKHATNKLLKKESLPTYKSAI